MAAMNQTGPSSVPDSSRGRSSGSNTHRHCSLDGWESNFGGLRSQIDLDLGHLENSISRLESQVDSLAEIGVQN